MKRWPHVASFVLFIALCVSLAYWAMQLFKPPLRAVAAPPTAIQVAPNLDAAAGLFGGRSTVAVASNFQLKGVVVSGTPSDSVAILAADGKPPQAIRVNGEVAPGVTVKEVHRQYVLLSDGGVIKKVELPEGAKSDASMAVSGRAPVPASAAQTAPSAPPRVVVSPPAQSQPAMPTPGASSSPPAATGPDPRTQTGSAGAAVLPGNTGNVPGTDMSGPSIGYNPAGAQAASPPLPAPSAPAVSATQGGMPAPPSVPQSQPMPQSSTGTPVQPAPTLPAASSQQR